MDWWTFYSVFTFSTWPCHGTKLPADSNVRLSASVELLKVKRDLHLYRFPYGFHFKALAHHPGCGRAHSILFSLYGVLFVCPVLQISWLWFIWRIALQHLLMKFCKFVCWPGYERRFTCKKKLVLKMWSLVLTEITCEAQMGLRILKTALGFPILQS